MIHDGRGNRIEGPTIEIFQSYPDKFGNDWTWRYKDSYGIVIAQRLYFSTEEEAREDFQKTQQEIQEVKILVSG